MSQRFSILLLPIATFLAGLYVSVYVDKIPSVWQELLQWLPIILATVVVMLAWHFNKGRVLLAVLLFIVPLTDITTLGSVHNLSSFFVATVLGAAMLGKMAERGFFNRFAINRILLLFVLFLWCYALLVGWVHIQGMNTYLVPLTKVSIPLLVMGLILFVSVLFLLMKWWQQSDFFSACLLVSLFSFTVLNTMSLTGKQEAIILSSVFLLWSVYLLIDSHKMAYIDDLTQLPGRRALNERLVSLSKRYAIAMLDVDHFKNFNDTYGHDMGDVVLKRVAKNVARVTNGGKGFRYGGEEFAIVFANKSKQDVQEALELVRKSVESEVVSLIQPKNKNKTVSVTISIGAAFAKSDRKAEDVIKKADDCLYKAKKAGRNKVVLESGNHIK